MRVAITNTAVMVLMTKKEMDELSINASLRYKITTRGPNGDLIINLHPNEEGGFFGKTVTALTRPEQEFKLTRSVAQFPPHIQENQFGLTDVDFTKVNHSKADGHIEIPVPFNRRSLIHRNPRGHQSTLETKIQARLPFPPDGTYHKIIDQQVSLQDAISAIATINKFADQNAGHVVLSVEAGRVKFLVEG